MNDREAMTLERIRDYHRNQTIWLKDHPSHVSFHKACIAAIDAHLSRAAEPVYQVRYVIMGSEKDWFEVCRDDFEKLAAFRCDDIVTQERRILYTHPPEPARDAKDMRAMVRRAMNAEWCDRIMADCLLMGTDYGEEMIEAALKAAMAQGSGDATGDES